MKSMYRRIFNLLQIAVIASLAIACSKFDDSKIWAELDAHAEKIAELEKKCTQMNSNISSIQTILTALQNNDYVTNVAPVVQGGETVGYAITFSKSGSITIYHGEDGAGGQKGEDGKTPQISVRQDSDGIYYWTVDGEWLLDASGIKVPATGPKGDDGQPGNNGQQGASGEDGVTPQLKIEGGNWYVSYDSGATWTLLGPATGESGSGGAGGDSLFESVTVNSDDNTVTFTLNDGSTFVLPMSDGQPIKFRKEGTEIISSMTNILVDVNVAYDQIESLAADIEEQDAIYTKSAGGWKASLAFSSSSRTATVTVTPDSSIEKVFLKVTLVKNDGTFHQIIKVLTTKKAESSYALEFKGFQKESKFNSDGQFFKDGNSFSESYWVSAETGATGSVLGPDNLRVYTFSYVIESQWSSYWDNSEENASWITATLDGYVNGGGEIQERSLSIKVAANEGDVREGMVLVMPESEAPEYDYSIFPNGQTIDSKYEKYVVTTITQDKESEAVGFLSAKDPEWMEEDGTTLTMASSNHWLLGKFDVDEVYTLTYTKKGSSDSQGSNILCSVEGFTSKYFDYEVQEMASASSWLNVFTFGTGNFRVEMFPDRDGFGEAAMANEGVKHKGFIVLYKDGVAFTAIECISNERNGGETSESGVAFLYPSKVDGASLVQVTSDNITEMNSKYSSYGIDFEEDFASSQVYVLTYTKEQPSMAELIIPTVSSPSQIMINPWGIGWLTNESPWTEDGKMVTLFKMTKPEAEEQAYAIVRFYNSSWDAQLAIIYCFPEF